jgi:hypothetical protein
MKNTRIMMTQPMGEQGLGFEVCGFWQLVTLCAAMHASTGVHHDAAHG